MFDVLKTLTTLVQNRQPKQKIQTAKQPQKPVVVKQPSVDNVSQIHLIQTQAKEILLEAKDEALRIRRQAEDEVRNKLISIDRREGAVEEREKKAAELEERAKKIISEIEKLKADAVSKLEKISHLTREQATSMILSAVRDELKEDVAKIIKEEESAAREEADKKAKEILVDAMRHGATDYVPEFTVSVVKVTDEDMKGRIIGKEGRNIRAFEMATGVDVDLDEEGVIRLSCFDPVRREIARVSLERLLRDGRVQPTRIEELVEIVKKEIERIMFDEGQKLCHAVGVYNLPTPLVAYLGRFKYRFSYGQNMIAHTLEETKIGIALAHEVGADVNVVRLGCLLHDIGKIVTDEEGSHIELGVSLLKKYGIPQNVIDCVAQHHEDTPFTSIESMIVYISDAISGSRPGARYEDIEGYLKRLKDLETIAKSKKGVREAFAFQAGRELRIIVDPGTVDDAAATVMAHEVKEEVEKNMTYPGQIKISVIRELRATEIAK